MTGEFSSAKCVQCIFCDVFSMCLECVAVSSEKSSVQPPWPICAFLPQPLVLILPWLVPRGILQRQLYVILPGFTEKETKCPSLKKT